MDKRTDEQLVDAYLKGEEPALEILIGRYLSPLYNFAFKYVRSQMAAEDVAQEALVKIWRNLKKYKPAYKFKTWAFTITKNTALDYLKRKGLVALAETDGFEDGALMRALVSAAPLPEEIIERAENAQTIKTAVAKLSGKYRQVLALYYEYGLNFREIAETLKESIDTIKTRHRRAVIYLKKDLRDK